MRITFCLMFLLAGLVAQAQITVEKLNKAAIPKSIIFKGQVVDAAKFSDKDGEHLVVLTETGETPTKDADSDDSRDAALYAYHYLNKAGSYKQTWAVQDFVKDCPVDITANFTKNTFAVTDLDKNGIAEIWMMYKTVCHGDVSPSAMKIIMYEGVKKHAMRGENKVKVSEKNYIGGKYTFDPSFNSAPTAFRAYAVNLWNRNILEKWDQ